MQTLVYMIFLIKSMTLKHFIISKYTQSLAKTCFYCPCFLSGHCQEIIIICAGYNITKIVKIKEHKQ